MLFVGRASSKTMSLLQMQKQLLSKLNSKILFIDGTFASGIDDLLFTHDNLIYMVRDEQGHCSVNG